MHQRRIRFVILFCFIVSLLVAACRAGNQQSETPANQTTISPTATSEADTITVITADGEEMQVAPPPPDAIELILDRVEAGNYTLDEAVIAALRIFAGEESDLDLFGGQPVQPLAGFRLSMLAAEVYANADAATKAEIERIANKLFPNAGETAQLPTQSLQGGLLARPPKQDDCTDDSYIYVRAGDIEGVIYNILVPEVCEADPRAVRLADATALAIEDSIRVYSQWASNLRDIEVYISGHPGYGPAELAELRSESVGAMAGFFAVSEIYEMACPIYVMPWLINFEPNERFRQLVAHEVFHCVERWEQGDISHPVTAWYAEGMADYFSGVVYPDANLEHQQLDAFNLLSASRSIVDMSYPAWVFFQYLGDAFGKEFVFDFLHVLPTAGTREDQLFWLAGSVDENTFHQFGQAFLDQKLRDENGRTLPMSAVFLAGSSFSLTPGSDRLFEAGAFQLSRYRVSYEADKLYQVTFGHSGGGIFSARRIATDGAWGDLPTDLKTRCVSQDYFVLITKTEPGSEYRVSSHTEWPEEYECDECLMGTWEQDTAQIETNLRTTMGPLAGELTSVSGVFVLDISDAGFVTYPENYAATFQQGELVGEVRMEGFSKGSYAVVDDGILQSFPEETAFSFTVTIGGRAQEFTPSIPTAWGLYEGLWNYTCTDTELTIFTPEGVAPFSSSTYTRISEPPE